MERKIGVYVCECGPNIAEKVDIDKVLNAVSSLEGVAVAEKYKLLCSVDGKKFLEDEIKKQEKKIEDQLSQLSNFASIVARQRTFLYIIIVVSFLIVCLVK